MNIYDCALLCELSYAVNTSGVYEPATQEEIDLFDKVSNDIVYIGNEDSDQCCIITTYGKLQIIIFRGTDSIEDGRYNFNIINTILDNDIQVHKGFHEAFLSIKKQVFDTITCTNLIICGHSLGGVLARICSYYVKKENPETDVKIVTFGSPKFCNAPGVAWFTEHIPHNYNVLNSTDPIIHYPRFGGYAGINKDIIYLRGEDMVLTTTYPTGCTLLCFLNRIRTHYITVYKELCKKHLVTIA